MAGRARANRADGKCHRNDTAAGSSRGKGETAVQETTVRSGNGARKANPAWSKTEQERIVPPARVSPKGAAFRVGREDE